MKKEVLIISFVFVLMFINSCENYPYFTSKSISVIEISDISKTNETNISLPTEDISYPTEDVSSEEIQPSSEVEPEIETPSIENIGEEIIIGGEEGVQIEEPKIVEEDKRVTYLKRIFEFPEIDFTEKLKKSFQIFIPSKIKDIFSQIKTSLHIKFPSFRLKEYKNEIFKNKFIKDKYNIIDKENIFIPDLNLRVKDYLIIDNVRLPLYKENLGKILIRKETQLRNNGGKISYGFKNNDVKERNIQFLWEIEIPEEYYKINEFDLDKEFNSFFSRYSLYGDKKYYISFKDVEDKFGTVYSKYDPNTRILKVYSNQKLITENEELILDPEWGLDNIYDLDFVSWTLYNTPGGIDIDGNYLYVSTNAFIIMDISDELNPVELSHLRELEPGMTGSIASQGDYVFATWDGKGIRVIDVSDKSNPYFALDSFEPSYQYDQLYVDSNYLYGIGEKVWDSKEFYFHIIDISDPLNPILVGNYNLSLIGIGAERLPRKYVVEGNIVYLISYPPGHLSDDMLQLHVLDISNPGNIITIGEPINISNVESTEFDIEKNNNYLYITAQDSVTRSRLKIIDISNINTPIIYEWGETLTARDIEIINNYAYVTDSNSGIHALELTNPLNPQELDYVRMPVPDYYPKPFNLKVIDNRAYMYFWDVHALYIVDITVPNNIFVIDENGIEFGHALTDAAVSDNDYLYAAVWDWKQLYTIDMNNPELPEVVNRTEVLGGAWGVDVEGNYVYEAMASASGMPYQGGLQIFDISNPEAPVRVGYNPPHEGLNNDVQVYVDTNEMRAYVAIGDDVYDWNYFSEEPGMRIVDVSDPSNPVELGNYTFGNVPGEGHNQSRSIHKQGNYVYVAAREGGLYIINVADPANPTFTAQWIPPLNNKGAQQEVLSVFAKDDYLYVTYGQNLSIFDISNPETPSLIKDYPIGLFPSDIIVDNNLAYIVGDSYLKVFNVTDPNNVVQVASQENIFVARPIRVDVKGDYIYVVTDVGAGIYTFTLDIPEPSGYNLEFVSWVGYHTPEYIDVDASENYIYVGTNAFVIEDISDKSNPVEASHLRPLETGMVRSLINYGDYVYAVWESKGVRVIDVSDKVNPEIVSTNFDPDYNYRLLYIQYPYLYAYVLKKDINFYQLQVIDVTDPTNLVLYGSYDLSGIVSSQGLELTDAVFDGNYAYVTIGQIMGNGIFTDGAKLLVFDIANPQNPALIGTPLVLGDFDTGQDEYYRRYLRLDKKDNYLYITGYFANPEAGMKIVDVSNPNSPIIVNNAWIIPSQHPGETIPLSDIDIEGNYAYVTGHLNNNMYVLDLVNPLNPQQMGSLSLPLPGYYNKIFDIKVKGNYAYLHMWDNYAIYIVDVSAPTNPQLLNTIPFGHDHSDVSAPPGDYVFMSIWDYLQLYTVDMRNPQLPNVSQRTETRGGGMDVDVKENYAYLAMGPDCSSWDVVPCGGLHIYDITNPNNPVFVGNSSATTGGCDIQVYVDVSEMKVYIVDGESIIPTLCQSTTPGLRIVDVSDPSNPVQLGRYNIPIGGGTGLSVHKSGNYAYLAGKQGGLYIIDVSDSANPTLAAQWTDISTPNALAKGVFVKNNYAYLAYGNSIRVLDISNPATPVEIANYPFSAHSIDVVVDENYAYVITDNALVILDVTDPTNPVEVASQVDVFSVAPTRIDVKGEYIYVVLHNGGLYTFRLEAGAGGQTCEVQNGYVCESNQYCNGELIQASNTENCCSVPCSDSLLCSECSGLFGFGCTREECYNIPEGCYFINNFIWPNDCNSCINANCESYSNDQQTCIDDPCDLGNCIWNTTTSGCQTITAPPGPGPSGPGGGGGTGGSPEGSEPESIIITPPIIVSGNQSNESLYQIESPLSLYTIDFANQDVLEIELEEKNYLLKIDNNDYTLVVNEINENNVNLQIDSKEIDLIYNVKGAFNLVNNKILYISLLNINNDKANIRFEVSSELPLIEEKPRRTIIGDLVTENSIIISSLIIFVILILLIIFYLLKIRNMGKKRYNKEDVMKVIKDALAKGHSEEQIKVRFMRNGWDEKEIDKLLKKVS